MSLLSLFLEIDCGLEMEFLEGFASERRRDGKYNVIDERRKAMGRSYMVKRDLTRDQAELLCAKLNGDDEE